MFKFYKYKYNFTSLFEIILDFIKPPFIIKILKLPKDKKKRKKQKFFIKIFYKNELKRLRESYKQLQYYSNKFDDSKFLNRLYKAILFSFLETKNSFLYKQKKLVFKKFLKI